MAVFGAVVPLLLFFVSCSNSAQSSRSDLPLLKDNALPPLPVPVWKNVSKRCEVAIRNLTQAMQFIYADAIGKPGAGVSAGDLSWLGSYSECKAIPDAHYCLANVDVYLIKVKRNLAVKWGLCVPEECDPQSVTQILENVIKDSNTYLYSEVWLSLIRTEASPDPVHCAMKSKYTTGAVVALSVCGVILLLCLVGTVLDMMYDCTKDTDLVINVNNGGFVPLGGSSTEVVHTVKPSDALPLYSDGSNQHLHSSNFHSSTSSGLAAPTPIKNNAAHIVLEFFQCFSLIRNTSRIMDTKVPSGAITSINGMRVLSMWWVILGHTLMTVVGTNSSNFAAVALDLLHRFTFQALDNAFFSVDSFFFLSGLLATYLGLRQMERLDGKFPQFLSKFYFHRFWRLTPAYMFVLLFYAKLMGFLGEGPMWFQVQQNPLCDKYWWTNLLYINNFYPTSLAKECMGWSWYLANDMQFYAISPVILYAAHRFGVLGFLASAGTLLVGGFVATGVIIHHYDLSVVLDGGIPPPAPGAPIFTDLVYTKPYCRISPYLVGMGLGFILHRQMISTRRVPLVGQLIGWAAAIIMGISTVYGQYKTLRKDSKPFTKAENIMYGTFSRFAWGLALAWVVYACHRGGGGLINKFLSASFWTPLSRLTYSAYLVHLIAISVFFGSFETVVAYSDVHLAFYFAGVVVISYMAAFCVAVCVEYPMMQLERLIFKAVNSVSSSIKKMGRYARF